MAEDSSVDQLREESSLRNELAHQVRDILLTFGRKCLLVSRTAPEGDHYDLALVRDRRRPGKRIGAQQHASKRHSCGAAQEFATAASNRATQFLRRGSFGESNGAFCTLP